MNLSERIRPNVEAAQWVVDEVRELEAQKEDWRVYAIEAGAQNARMNILLAASQAREQQLREALEFYSNKCHIEHLLGKRDWIADRAALEAKGFQFEWEDCNGGETFIEHGMAAEEALAIPSDTAALEALIARAGEVMRERCATLIDYDYSLKGANSIRALPGVTLDDLKGAS